MNLLGDICNAYMRNQYISRVFTNIDFTKELHCIVNGQTTSLVLLGYWNWNIETDSASSVYYDLQQIICHDFGQDWGNKQRAWLDT